MTHRIYSSPTFRTIAAVAVAATVALGVVLARSATAEAAGPPPSTTPVAGTPSSVRLGDAQWAALDIRAVAPAAFATLASADAVVAVDDRTTVPIFSPATGRVTAVAVELGQSVRRGQALASIAGLETAQAAADLASAGALARTAERQLALAREVAARQQGLVAAGGGAAKDWRQSQSDLIAAEGAQRSADAALAAARVKAASVGADGAGQLVSPIAGQVIQRQVAAGQFVSSLAAGGQAPLFTISDLRHVWIVGSLGEREGVTLQVGQAVEISGLAGMRRPVRSVISWVAPTIDPSTRRLQFRAELANLDLALRPQMTARVRVLDSHAAPALAVPSVAIVHDGDAAHCYVVTAPHTLTLRSIEIGRSEDGLTEVLAGLKPGDRIVARGAIFVDALAEGAAS